MFIQADLFSQILFSIFTLIMFIIIAISLKKTTLFKSWMSLFLGLNGILILMILSGVMARNPIPVIPIFMFSLLLFSFFFSFSRVGTEISSLFSLSTLVLFQSFRFPLELILHHWANLGTIPKTMTWSGSNIDIWAGIISLILFRYVDKNRTLAWLSQIIGLGLLINVLRVVVMSSPFPFSWKLDVPLQLALYLPYAFITTFFVMPALIVHLITLKKLCSSERSLISSPS